MLVRPLFAALTQTDDFAGVVATAKYGEPGLPPRFVPYYYDQGAPGIEHTNLSSHNIMASADGRFRVSGFGLTRVKSFLRDKGHARDDDGFVSEWLAPELRDDARYAPHAGKADVYSFGVVMRHHPSPKLAKSVVRDEYPPLPLPRRLPTVPAGYLALMHQCCSLHPINRPSFSHIKSCLGDLASSL
ncbi:protein kinase [Acanthamoeba castellanii str. Neff]|uniref:Protein kinase n=1 Tax=Acanthamoeba castellanii (strain ATCC 30010 / Neff) TaxID=1257118 RepID=L8HA02_ACACF|nr:protein kinase [Acanthamoeba castellanii str. Neff]ELR22359.1 protein kinase [Acanthamoeba castellanii str. Neff]